MLLASCTSTRLMRHSPTWGDAFTPNFFARGDRLTQNNYQQYLAEKRLGSRAVASADYTHPARLTHAAGSSKAGRARAALGSIPARVELYQRVNGVVYYGVPAAAGAGRGRECKQNSRKTGTGGNRFASIDDNYASYSGSPFLEAVGLSWNSDSFVNGKRAFTKVDWKLAPGFHLTGMYNHKTAEGEILDQPSEPEWGFRVRRSRAAAPEGPVPSSAAMPPGPGRAQDGLPGMILKLRCAP